MRRFFKSKTFWTLLVIVVAIAAIVVYGKISGSKNYADKYKDLDFDKLVEESRSDTYNAYYKHHKDAGAGFPTEDIVVPLNASSVVGKDGDKSFFDTIEGENVLVNLEDGYTDIKFDVKEAGFYYVKLRYYPDQDPERSRGTEIEFAFQIKDPEDGEMKVPFSGADAPR